MKLNLLSLFLMDPYIVIQQEVINEVAETKNLIETRDDMLNDTRGINLIVFKDLGYKTSLHIKNVISLINDINETIKKIQQNPERFNISSEELSNRINWIQKITQEINQLSEKLEVQSNDKRVIFVPAKIQDDREDTVFLPIRESNQATMYETQEEQIDQIEETVKMQKNLAKEISSELDDQQEILLNLDNGIDDVNMAMKSVTNQIKRLIDEEGKTPVMLICILSIVLVVLIFFLI